MAFREMELKQWEPMIASFIEQKRPPEELRSQVDIDYAIEDQSFIVYTIRPKWDQPEEKLKLPLAKVTWVRTQQVWNIYWRRADLKWHEYDPLPQTGNLEEFIEELRKDPYACFWG